MKVLCATLMIDYDVNITDNIKRRRRKLLYRDTRNFSESALISG